MKDCENYRLENSVNRIVLFILLLNFLHLCNNFLKKLSFIYGDGGGGSYIVKKSDTESRKTIGRAYRAIVGSVNCNNVLVLKSVSRGDRGSGIVNQVHFWAFELTVPTRVRYTLVSGVNPTVTKYRRYNFARR